MKAKLDIRMRSVQQTTAAITQIDDKMRQAVRRGIARHCEIVLTKSQEEGEVPRITGKLARSAFQEVFDKPEPHGVIGYRAPYAVAVHEIPRPLSSNGKWKYLEDPFRLEEPRYIERVADECAKAMAKVKP